MTERFNFADQLKARPKSAIPNETRVIDDLGEAHGFVDRTPRRKPGRKPGPRTMQMHPKIREEIGEAMLDEAEALGITQGRLIELMWAAYRKETGAGV